MQILIFLHTITHLSAKWIDENQEDYLNYTIFSLHNNYDWCLLNNFLFGIYGGRCDDNII